MSKDFNNTLPPRSPQDVSLNPHSHDISTTGFFSGRQVSVGGAAAVRNVTGALAALVEATDKAGKHNPSSANVAAKQALLQCMAAVKGSEPTIEPAALSTRSFSR